MAVLGLGSGPRELKNRPDPFPVWMDSTSQVIGWEVFCLHNEL